MEQYIINLKHPLKAPITVLCFDSDILAISSLILQGVKKAKFGPQLALMRSSFQMKQQI